MPERVDERAVEPRPGAPAVAYLMSRFPKVTETFVLYEAVALLDEGREVRLFPLLLEPHEVEHPEVERVRSRLRFRPFVSAGVVGANLATLARHPVRYLRALCGLPLALWRSPRFLGGALAYFPKCVAYARDMQAEGIAHVHAHFANHPATAAWVIHRLTGLPYSFTAHGSDLHVDQTGLGAKLRRAAFAVQISDYNRRFVLEHVGDWAAPRLRVVRCGVDLAAFPVRAAPGPSGEPAQVLAEQPAAPLDAGRGVEVEPVARAPLAILCVASLRKVKGHVHLFEALRRLRDTAVPFRCRLVGDGPERERLEHLLVELGLAAHVELLGSQPRPRVLEELARADVVVLTSVQDAAGRREGIPVSLMEAMASGLPVLASDLSGIPELVTHGVEGILVPPGDPERIALGLTRLWEDPALRHQMGTAGRHRIESEYDLRKNARTLVRLFDTSLGPRPSARPPRPRLVAG